MQAVQVTTLKARARSVNAAGEPVIHRREPAEVRTVEPIYSLAGDIQLFKNNTRRTHQNILEALHMAFGGKTHAG